MNSKLKDLRMSDWDENLLSDETGEEEELETLDSPSLDEDDLEDETGTP
ncbi:MAG: hypothetical protein G01um101420_18 [Parcubacteria group bacterium Gr01-1014_20]|nr:MAG: hypothetical protein G01um101420_18 [Parcubacteria group bacterium Gr01-1014_20]